MGDGRCVRVGHVMVFVWWKYKVLSVYWMCMVFDVCVLFFFKYTATTEIYTE